MLTITQNWIDFILQTKRFSPHTATAYSHDIIDFIKFMNNHKNSPLTPSTINQVAAQDIRSWLAHRHANKLSPRSTARALSSLRNFARYCSKYHQIELDALSSIKSPRIKKGIPRPLNQEQSSQLLNEIDLLSEDAWIGQRNKAFFMLLYGTGLRISEALSLTGGVLTNTGQITVLGKGKKSRVVPILDIITTELNSYAKLCPHSITKDSALFLGKQGRILAAGVAQKALRDYRRSVGLPDSVTPHALRHTCASHLMNASSDLRGIQELLGHASLSSTQIYTQLDQEKILETYKAAHPRGKISSIEK